MKHVGTLGTAMVAMFALSAVVASTASALGWLDNGHPIASPILVLSKSTGSIKISDLAPFGGPIVLLCSRIGHGTIGPGDKGEIKELHLTGCSFEAGKTGECKTSPSPTFLWAHLPWATLLLTVGGVTHNMTESSGAGAPAWAFTCETLTGTVTDECISSTMSPGIDGNFADVTALFEASDTASCTLGNATSGMIVGPELVFSDNPLLKISTG